MRNRKTATVASIFFVLATASSAIGHQGETQSPFYSIIAGDRYESTPVEPEREGQMWLVKNDCSAPNAGCTHTALTIEEAVHYARRYRWIDVSASMKSVAHGLWEAELKLLGSGADALVFVYLPEGLTQSQVSDGWWVWHALNLKYWEGGYAVNHPVFQDKFGQLMSGATAGGRYVLVTSKSYGAHQTLEAVHNNPAVYHLSIGPSFGEFRHVDDDALNPQVNVYWENLRTARNMECIVTSPNDCWSLNAIGSAFTRSAEVAYLCPTASNGDEYAPAHGDPLQATTSCLVDPVVPGSTVPPASCYVYGNANTHGAVFANSEKIKTVLAILDPHAPDEARWPGAAHGTASYFDHGLIAAMRSCPARHALGGGVLESVLNGTWPPQSGITMSIAGGYDPVDPVHHDRDIQDRDIIYLSDPTLSTTQYDIYASGLPGLIPGRSFLNHGHTIPIQLEVVPAGDPLIDSVSFSVDGARKLDLTLPESDVRRLGPDFSYDWSPSSSAQWFTLGAGATWGAWTQPFSARRVLVMRMVDNTFPHPIPDLTGLTGLPSPPSTIPSNSTLSLNAGVYLPKPAQIGRLRILVTSSAGTDTLASGDATTLLMADRGTYRTYAFGSNVKWKVAKTWCTVAPKDPACALVLTGTVAVPPTPTPTSTSGLVTTGPLISGPTATPTSLTASGTVAGSTPPYPAKMTVRITVTATNSQGKSVTSTQDVTIQRASDWLE
ncbi:MAG: hypothetical protein HYV63_33020 [Candidatus Schekmanbacteria bacterium]|nr:hypothetical protein [Candidatus Schekmanbacteria bacterium]